MKLKASSSNTVFWKDITRFAPAWVLFGLFLAVMFLTVIGNGGAEYWLVANLADFIPIMSIFNCAYALLAAQLLFGDLYNSRMCNALHAMPLKRERWFFAHVKAGMCFSVAPTAVAAAVLAVLIRQYSTFRLGWQVPLYWWAGVNLQYLFFFGLAAFSAMCVGTRFAMAVVYGMLNMASMLVYLLVDGLYTPLFYGAVTPTEIFFLLCPVVQLAGRNRLLLTERVDTGNTYVDGAGVLQHEYVGMFTVEKENWIYLGILAVVGIFLLAAALGMYRRRKLEAAGDFLANRVMEPVFQILFTILCASGFQAVFYIFLGSNGMDHLLMAIGMVTGWFAGRMFLERTVRVFRLKNILGLAAMAAVVGLSLWIAALDPMGIESWIPQAGEVESVHMGASYNTERTVKETEEIEKILKLHSVALEERPQLHPDYDYSYHNPMDESGEAVQVELTYTMKNGRKIQRNYRIWVNGEAGQISREFFSDPACVVSEYGMELHAAEDLLRSVRPPVTVTVDGYAVPAEYRTEEFVGQLMEAILADCEEGTLVQHSQYHPEYLMEEPVYVQSVELGVDYENSRLWVMVYADSRHTMALLEQTGMPQHILEEVLLSVGG